MFNKNYPWEIPHWWSTNSSVSFGPVTNDLGVNCTGNTVVQLRIKFWQLVLWVDRSLGNVTDSSCLDDVPDDELLDRLVFWHTTGAVGATHWFHVATTVLCTSSIPSFTRLKK